MAHDQKTRDKLCARYVHGLSLPAAAKATGVPLGTARRWKERAAEDGMSWDVQRNARHMTSGGMEEMTNQVLSELAEQFTATIKLLREDKAMGAGDRAKILVALMDGYNKAIGAASRAMPNAGRLAVAMDVLKFLNLFIAERFPKLRQAFVDVSEAAGDDLVREFGSGGS